MFSNQHPARSITLRWLLIFGSFGLVTQFGCVGANPEMSDNAVFALRLEKEIGEPLPAEGLADIQAALAELFGTADQPVLPPGVSVVSIENLNRSAGRAYSDQADVHFGLYRNNCIRCHGTAGDGRGPAAKLLAPYPRDFRLGVFKFKSTAQGSKPTKGDLQRLLLRGIPGTSMPSFSNLPAEDLDALVDYVIYLSVRGETERALLAELAHNLDYARGDRVFDADAKQSDPVRYAEQLTHLQEIATNLYARWDQAATPLPGLASDQPLWRGPYGNDRYPDEELVRSIDRGERLFKGNVASCSKCHGLDGSGADAPLDFDLWTKDWTVAAGIDLQDKSAIRPLIKVGALKPVQMFPRNLRLGIFRGGATAQDLYYRIVNGIEGTSMPAQAMHTQVADGLTEGQIWDLVNYVCSLSNAALQTDAPEYRRADVQESTQ